MSTTMWILLLVIFLVVEASTVSLVSIWFAGGSVVGLVMSALHMPWWFQILCALITALILLFFTRPVAAKYFNQARVKTNVESLIGMHATVTEEVNNVLGTGQAVAGNLEWTTRSISDDTIIPIGAKAVIEEIKGVKLIVRYDVPSVENEQCKENE